MTLQLRLGCFVDHTLLEHSELNSSLYTTAAGLLLSADNDIWLVGSGAIPGNDSIWIAVAFVANNFMPPSLSTS